MTKPSPAMLIRAARDLHRAGLDAACTSRPREALGLLRRGMELTDRMHPVEPDSRADWLQVRIRLACTLAFVESETSGVVGKGLARLDEVRLLLDVVPSPQLRAELTGAIDHNYGTLLFGVGRNEDSLQYLDVSMQHQQFCIEHADDPRSLIDAFLKTLATRGLAYARLGDIRRSREDLTHGIELAEKHDLTTQAADMRQPLGRLELRTGNVPAALRSFDQSERIYATLGSGAPALLRLNQAEALLTAGLADEASKHLDEVLPQTRSQLSSRELASAEMFRATAGLMNDELDLARRLAASARRRMLRWGCATCVANAALIGLRADVREALLSGKVPPALPARAMRVAASMSAPQLVDQAMVARMLAARLEIRRGRLGRAAELVGLIPRPGQLTPIDHRMLRRLCRAELAAAQGNVGRALGEIRTALAELDKVRDRMGGLELVSGTAAHGQELADLAVRLVLAGANPKRTFDWLERTRAQTFRYEPIGGDDPELAERVAEVRSLTQAIHQAEHDGHPTATLKARLNERLREAHRVGWHAGRWGKPRPVAGLVEVGERLKDRALVSFVASEDSLAAVVLVDGDVRMVQLGSAKEAAEQARMLNADLNALAPDHLPPPLVQVVSASARKQADLIDRQVVHPLGQLIEGRDLVIVPTGALYAVPWGVLPSLIGRPTVVAPSATAWLAAERAGSPADERTVLVRAPGLPAAVGEIDKLGAHHTTAKLVSGEQATVATVLEALDGAKLAHIAAHGAHEPENALFSKLELADGALFAHEMAGLAKPPQQVVLAACELALNRIRPGDEALGFASALLALGSQTVIAPVSRVGDQASAAAMDDYHRGLAAGAAPAVALADAIAVDPLRRPFVCLGTST